MRQKLKTKLSQHETKPEIENHGRIIEDKMQLSVLLDLILGLDSGHRSDSLNIFVNIVGYIVRSLTRMRFRTS